MAEPLITVPELAAWSQETIPADDPFAALIIDAASLVVRDEAEHPEWTAADAPVRAKLIVAILAKAAWLNPNGLKREGSVGPIGGDTPIDEVARAMLFELTPAQKEALHSFRDGGGKPGLWLQPTGTPGVSEPVYVGTIGPTVTPESDWMVPWYSSDEAWIGGV